MRVPGCPFPANFLYVGVVTTPPPSPVPVNVALHAAPTEWWHFLSALAPLAVLSAAVIAGWIAWKSLSQKSAADNRAEWWRRAEWAFDSFLSQEPRRAQVGLQAMTILAESTPSSEEVEITTVAWAKPLEEAADLQRMDSAPSDDLTLPYASDDLDDVLDRRPDSGNNESARHEII